MDLMDSLNLTMLRDPQTGQELRLATATELETVAQNLKSERLDALLISADGRRAYPIEGGLALLLTENCLELEHLLPELHKP
jgi:uncharacterized protein YbaR (Trm112 family)